jgi:hypothetical protein
MSVNPGATVAGPEEDLWFIGHDDRYASLRQADDTRAAAPN